MKSPEYQGDSELHEDQAELIEQYKASLASLHRFSDTVREIGPAGGDLIDGNRGAILDMCAAIETILDHDLTRLEKPEYAEINVAGEPYNPDALALATIEAVVDRLRRRVEALDRPTKSEPS